MPIITRVVLSYLASTGVVVGTWAYVFPLGFYQAFPGLGRVWVAVDGPFNEHLVRDTGAAYLMIAALAGSGWSGRSPRLRSRSALPPWSSISSISRTMCGTFICTRPSIRH